MSRSINKEVINITTRERFILFTLYNKKLTANQIVDFIHTHSNGELKLSTFRCLVILSSLNSRGYLYSYHENDNVELQSACTTQGKLLVETFIATHNKLLQTSVSDN